MERTRNKDKKEFFWLFHFNSNFVFPKVYDIYLISEESNVKIIINFFLEQSFLVWVESNLGI